jgi:molecular chaperone IbpA
MKHSLSLYDPFAVGFERTFHLLSDMLNDTASHSFPPYNIVKIDDDTYRIDVAVAGFVKDDLKVLLDGDILTIESKVETSKDDVVYIHRGIAKRRFKKTFTLAPFIEIQEVGMENGMLYIYLKHIVPEDKKPKLFEIK